MAENNAMDISEDQLSAVQRDFLAYWRKQAGDRMAPRRRDFDVLHVAKLMPHAVIFDVLHDPLDFRYRLVGTAVREMSSREYTGMKFSEIEGRGPGSNIWSILDNVRAGRKPALNSIPYVGPKKDFMALNNLVLPFVDENEETVMIVAVTHFLLKTIK